MRISDWSSDVCSSDLKKTDHALSLAAQTDIGLFELKGGYQYAPYEGFANQYMDMTSNKSWYLNGHWKGALDWGDLDLRAFYSDTDHRSEEHTSELQSLLSISYAILCLKKKNKIRRTERLQSTHKT